MVLSILLFVLGLVLLAKGGGFFVDGSVAIARRARLPRMIVGGTIVSVATTTPEFLVSVTASLQGNSGLAVGNAVGSVIINIGLVVGLLAVIRPFPVNPREFRIPAQVMLALAIILLGLTWNLELTRWEGLGLLIAGIAYLAGNSMYGRNTADRDEIATEGGSKKDTMRSGKKVAGLFILGLTMVAGGSQLVVRSGIDIATALGIPPLVIGLTMVSIGTSIPELVTAITAARRGVSDLSLGNLVGANVLNMTIVTGAAASIFPLAISRTIQAYNFPVMLLMVVVLMALTRRASKLVRWEGGILLGLYLAFMAGLVLVGT